VLQRAQAFASQAAARAVDLMAESAMDAPQWEVPPPIPPLPARPSPILDTSRFPPLSSLSHSGEGCTLCFLCVFEKSVSHGASTPRVGLRAFSLILC